MQGLFRNLEQLTESEMPRVGSGPNEGFRFVEHIDTTWHVDSHGNHAFYDGRYYDTYRFHASEGIEGISRIQLVLEKHEGRQNEIWRSIPERMPEVAIDLERSLEELSLMDASNEGPWDIRRSAAEKIRAQWDRVLTYHGTEGHVGWWPNYRYDSCCSTFYVCENPIPPNFDCDNDDPQHDCNRHLPR